VGAGKKVPICPLKGTYMKKIKLRREAEENRDKCGRRLKITEDKYFASQQRKEPFFYQPGEGVSG